MQHGHFLPLVLCGHIARPTRYRAKKCTRIYQQGALSGLPARQLAEPRDTLPLPPHPAETGPVQRTPNGSPEQRKPHL